MIYLKNEYNEKDGGLLFSIFIGTMLAAVFLIQSILQSFDSFYKTEAATWIAQSFLYLALLGAVIVYHRVQKINPIKALNLDKKFNAVDIIMSVVLGAGMLFTFLIFTFFWSYFLQEIGYKNAGGFPAINSVGTFILAIIIICVLPAITEETVFRGAVLKGYSKVFSPAAAVGLSALFFMLMHINPAQVVNPILTGIVMAILVHKTKTIKVSMIAHFTNNFIIVLMIYIESFSKGAGQSSGVIKFEDITEYLIFFAIGVVLLTVALVYFFTTKKRGRDSEEIISPPVQPVFADDGIDDNEIITADISIKRRRKKAILFALFGIIITVAEIILGIFL